MTKAAIIESCSYWNKTGFHVEKDKRYRYAAVGAWKDASVLCDADGWSSATCDLLLGWGKRCHEARWFQLVGSVDGQSPPIVMGSSGTFIAPASGELHCYANDGRWAYANNTGAVALTVAPVDRSEEIPG